MCEEKRVYIDPSVFLPFEDEVELTCPHCGKTFRWFSYNSMFTEERVECEACGKEFLVTSLNHRMKTQMDAVIQCGVEDA